MLKISGRGQAQPALVPGHLCSGRASSVVIKASTKPRSFAHVCAGEEKHPMPPARQSIAPTDFAIAVPLGMACGLYSASVRAHDQLHAPCLQSDPSGDRSQQQNVSVY